MWKYVGQRLIDSAEYTCSHIKILRSAFSTCNTKAFEDIPISRYVRTQDGFKRIDITTDGRTHAIWKCLDNTNTQINDQQSSSFDLDAPYMNVLQKYYQEKQKQKNHNACNGCLQLNYLQWTAGLLCSVYFGQMICFYSRRRQNMKRWNHLEQILSDRQLGQTLDKFKRSQYQRSFVPSNDVRNWYDSDQMSGIRALMPLLPVTNDHFTQDQYGSSTFIASAATSKQATTRRTEISFAVDDLIATLGSIEFRLGMQNLRANEPEVAVSHLKLATTHRHPEATFNLGVCYELGVGLEKDMKSAMECYRAAASLGHKKAMFNLGVFYVHGRGGLKKNRDAARACFEAADKMGLRQAAKALSLPEEPIKTDQEVIWKSSNLIAHDLSAVHKRRESSVI